MLILVAVTVSTVVNSGLFNKASDAGKEWKEAEEKEANVLTGNVTINGIEYDSIEDYVEEQVQNSMKVTIVDSENNSTKVAINEQTAGQYYGYKVAPSTYNIEGVTWRLFYIDFANEYGDGEGTVYLKADAIENSGGIPLTEDYSAANVTKFNRDFIPETTTIREIKAVSWLLNPDNWSTYKIDSKVNYAVGGPSLEMYVKSYNRFLAKHPELKVGDENPYSVAQPLEYNFSGGYFVGVSNTGIGGYNSTCDTCSTNNYKLVSNAANSEQTNQIKGQIEMYNPYEVYYWLASPAYQENDDLMSVYGGNSVLAHWAFNSDNSVCPIVSLKSNVKVTLVKEDA